MKRYEVRFSPSAESDLDSILLFIAADNPARALSFVEELGQRALDFLSGTPRATSSIGRYRYMVIGNYVMAFSVDEDAAIVRVQLVTDGHRNWHRLLDGLD